MKTALAASDNSAADKMLEDLARLHEEGLRREKEQRVREMAPTGFDRSVADGYSDTHKKYINSLADRTESESEKLMKTILKMRARIAIELEDERLASQIRAKVADAAEKGAWDPEKQAEQFEASKKFLLDVLQDDMMASLGTLAIGKNLHRNDANMMIFLPRFLAGINDPGIRKEMAKACKTSLLKAGYAAHDIDIMTKAMGSMPRLRAMLKKDSSGKILGIGVQLKSTYSEVWSMTKSAHRSRIDAVVKGITGNTALDKSLMSDVIGIAQREVEGMLPGNHGSHVPRELRRIKDGLSTSWGIGLEPDGVRPPDDLGTRFDLMAQRSAPGAF